jgi:hypothetical protein
MRDEGGYMKTLIVGLVVLVWGALAAAEPPQVKTDVPDLASAPSFSYLGSADGNGFLNMECDGEPPFREIYCHFTKIIFTRPKEEEKRTKRVEALVDLDQIQRADMTGFVPFFSADDMKKLEQQATASTPEKKAYLQEFIAAYKEQTVILGKSRSKAALTKPEEVQKGGCLVTMHGYDVALRYAGKNRWFSQTGPAGLCNAVRVWTLEKAPGAPSLWKFTEDRVAAIVENLCSGVQINKPLVFSWENPRDLPLNCTYISAGSW